MFLPVPWLQLILLGQLLRPVLLLRLVLVLQWLLFRNRVPLRR